MTVKYDEAVMELKEMNFTKFAQAKQGTAWRDVAYAVIAQIVNANPMAYVVCHYMIENKLTSITIEKIEMKYIY